MFNIGDKLTKNNYTQGAIWCNENNAMIELINGEYVIVAPVAPTLDEFKQDKRDEINKARDEAEQGGFEYLGKVFDSDPVSCQRIALASQTALISKQASQEFSVEWTCQDNSKITLSADETIGMSLALTSWSNSCHVKASELKALVDKAETKEEVDAINWELDLSTEQDSEQAEEIGNTLLPVDEEEE